MEDRKLVAAVAAAGTLAAALYYFKTFPRTQSNTKPKQTLSKVFAAVEGGGTTWRVALARDHPTNIIDRDEFATTTPEETLANVKAWLDARKFDALGVATFGPVDLHKGSQTYGYITTTPKPNWKFTDVLGPLTKGLGSIPVAFDTDVNAPAMAEFKYHGKKGESSCAYITVGTGIGVGLVVNGKCVHGLLHPEGGHVAATRHVTDSFPTTNPKAPFHGLSIESMANSHSVALRCGVSATELKDVSDDHFVWDHTSHYLATLCSNLVLLVSPERIVLSGGVMNREILFPMIRKKVQEQLDGYINMPQLTTDAIDEYIVPSKHGNDIGLIGALALAQVASEES